ncbi:hypothetical protein BV25DRAFT_1816702, partial [Artomyces pyxidatus]
MRYTPTTIEWSQIVHVLSKQAFQAIRCVLPLPTSRTLEQRRRREILFPIGITERTFVVLKGRLDDLKYGGPVGLACDDTKLLPSLRPHYDSERECYVLLGCVGKPMVLADPEELSRVIRQGKVEKAKKIRVWTIKIPLPRVPTIVLAAMAISDEQSAEQLFQYLQRLLNGLLSRGIKVISYAADGTSVERSVQRLLTASATQYNDYTIPHPGGRPPINLHIPLVGINRQPMAMIQDSNHGRKTYRNNAFSGARVLTLGNYTAMYSQFRLGAFDADGPLYRRDVEKLDRQDDNAATRLFSGHTLHWLNTSHPDLVGATVYLFVFGELIDAYQNRFLPLVDRVEMALRAYFFMEMWEDFLSRAAYAKSKHFLSPEARDITRFLVIGLLQLVIIYRDHLGGEYPLLPWLLTTEACEHVFGACRQIVKDFTMQDFHYMVPKLHIRLREHLFLSELSDGKERASGYNHTYTDTRGLDIVALATYPSDTDIRSATDVAFSGAQNLWAALGVEVNGLGSAHTGLARMPSIRTWYDEPQDSDDEDMESAHEEEDEDELDSEEEPDMLQIEHAIAKAEAQSMDTRTEDKVNSLTYAAAALCVQRSMTMYVNPITLASRNAQAISDMAKELADTLPSVRDPDERRPFWEGDMGDIDFDRLVAIRRAHHTVQAEKGVRTRGHVDSEHTIVPPVDVASASSAAPETGSKAAIEHARQAQERRLLVKIKDVLKDVDEPVRGITTGTGRDMRW